MSDSAQHMRLAAIEDWSAFESAIGRFVTAWQQGTGPAIDDYLAPTVGPRHALLVELVHTELELRLKAGEPARVEEYLGRYPELAVDTTALVELIAAEYELRWRADPQLGLDDYLQRFPQYRAELPGQIARRTTGAPGADTPQRRPGPHREEPPEVPGYEFLGPLGRGGMGTVYRVRQKSLDRPAALKLLPEECSRDPQWLSRFRREARTASALDHPHICTIYDTGEHAGRPFISMELIEGRTLETLVSQHLPPEEVARLVAQAARALAAAHAAGVVHRDVKPANVMVRNDGIVKVLDFGLAHRVPSVGPPDSRNETDLGSRAAGTLLYMSPEQARGEAVGTASDVFSLGLVLYELATGRHPFLADSEVGILHAIATETPLPAGRLNPEIPAALESLTQQMLAKDPRLRPSAADLDATLNELTGPRSRLPRSPAAGVGKRHTVGRVQERAALRAGFEEAAAGHGLLLCVTGEPGLGKTTLVEDFLDELTADDLACGVARGRCSERLAGTEAYLPFLEALDGLLQGEGGASAAQLMKVLAPTWYVQLAPLAVDHTDLAPVLAEARGAPQERLKRELALFLHELSRRQALVVFLDDVHWADPSSTDLLAYLGGRCDGLRLLLVLTYRPSDLLRNRHPFGPVKVELQARGVCREIALPLLSRADLDRYVGLAFAGHRFPEEFLAVLHARTEGHPLFLVDLLRYLRDNGVIVPDGGQWALARAVLDLQRELPELVRGMIQRKTDQLGEADRQLLTAASVQGPEFDSAVVARVLGRDPTDVEDRLEILERVHALVRVVREQSFPDGALTLRYRFVHVLYQNALYSSLRPTRKAAWSAAAAQALLGHYGEKSAAVAAELALLFEAAREPARAIDHFLLAAGNAVRVSAHPETVELARRGLGLLPAVPATPARAAQEFALLIALGVSLVATRGFASPEVEQTYLRAQSLCRREEDVPHLFPVLYGLWNVYLVRCELSQCKALAAQMFSLAGGQANLDYLLVAHNVMQQPLFHRGELAAARRHQEQGLALYDRDRHQSLTADYGEDPGVGCLVYGAVTLWHLGYPDQALHALAAGRGLADALGNPFNVAQALYYGTLTRLCRREMAAALALAGNLMELCREHGFALLYAGGLILHGRSLAGQGRGEEGIAQIRQGLADWRATGALSHRPYQLAALAETLAEVGRGADGLAALDEALAIAESTGERFWEAELQRLRGEILLARADGDAEACFRQALAVARGQGARSLELRAALSLGRLCRRQARQAEARPLLAEVCGWFTEGRDTPDLQEASALLEELGAS